MGVVKEDYGYFPMIFLSIFTDDVQNIQYWLALFDGITDVRWRKSVLQTYTFSQNAD